MGIFEDAVINVKSAFNVIGEKTGKIVDVSKLKINECEISHSISSEFEKLGRLVYDFKKFETNNEEQINETIKTIETLKEQLEAVKSQIAEAKQKKVCCNCSAENDIEMKFCGKCGCKLDKECECDCDCQTEEDLKIEVKEVPEAEK